MCNKQHDNGDYLPGSDDHEDDVLDKDTETCNFLD